MLDLPRVGKAVLAVFGVGEVEYPLATSLPRVGKAVIAVLGVGEEELEPGLEPGDEEMALALGAEGGGRDLLLHTESMVRDRQ